MDVLPVELVFQVFELLPEQDLVTLQLVSKRLLPIARANRLWREHCYDRSPAVKLKAWNTFTQTLLRPNLGASSANEAAATFASMLETADADSQEAPTLSTQRSEDLTPRDRRLREISEWDPSYDSETVDWYSEYIGRCGPLSISWFTNPVDEVRGLALWDSNQGSRAVGPLEDGTIAVWDVTKGHQIGRSAAGALFKEDGVNPHFSGAVECITVDSTNDTAIIAIGCQLKTVDLSNMRVISSHDFSFPITALSQSRPSSDIPTTVATRFSVHMFDPRVSTITPSPVFESPPSPSVAAGDSYPLAILNAPPHSIYLAGRYPSILTYDRRFFPRLENTIHSGARLCGLDLISPASPSSVTPSRSSLIACGEYNGRGSLELYSLPYQKEFPASHIHRNRQTASRSKLLSAASHGTRIVFSDADGALKWVERDGTSLVRSWNINEFTFTEPKTSQIRHGNRTVLEFGVQGGDVARKIIPLPTEESERGSRGDGELLLWTGEKAGILKFKDQENWEDAKETVEDSKGVASGEVERQSREAMEMEDAMRRALMRHTDEMNWMRRLGLA